VPRRLARTVTAAHHLHAPVFHRCVHQRDPHRQHLLVPYTRFPVCDGWWEGGEGGGGGQKRRTRCTKDEQGATCGSVTAACGGSTVSSTQTGNGIMAATMNRGIGKHSQELSVAKARQHQWNQRGIPRAADHQQRLGKATTMESTRHPTSC
jgi:hypothetical protein